MAFPACRVCAQRILLSPLIVSRIEVSAVSRYAKVPYKKRPRSPLSFRPPQDMEQMSDEDRMVELHSEPANQFLFGVHPCLLALVHQSRVCHRAFIRKDYYQTDARKVDNPSKMLRGVREILRLLEQQNVPIMLYNRAALNFMTQDKPHQGVVLEVSPRPVTFIDDENMEECMQNFSQQQHLIVLDKIRDPMNLGAVLRTCCFLMGPKTPVVLTPETSVLSPACCKASSGAVELLNFYKASNPTELIDALRASQGRLVIGTDEPEDSGHNLDLEEMADKLSSDVENGSRKSVLIFGFEGSGVSKELLDKCDLTVSIRPIVSDDRESSELLGVNSLNVSAALAIVLYRMLRNK